MSSTGFGFTVNATDATHKGLSKALTSVEAFARKAGSMMAMPFRAMGSMNTMALVANFNTLTGAMQKVADIVAEQEDSMSRLKVTLKASGYAAGFTAKQIGDMAQQMSKATAFEDEQIVEGQAVLARAGTLRGQMFKEASKVMVDMAAAMGKTDIPGVAKMLAIALNDPARGLMILQKNGVALTVTQRAMIKSLADSGETAKAQAAVLQALHSTFGGMAEEMANTTTGSVRRMQMGIEEIVKAGANAVSPLVKAAADKIDAWARSIAEKIEPLKTVVEANMGLLGEVAKSTGKIILDSLGVTWDTVGDKAKSATDRMIEGLKGAIDVAGTGSKVLNILSGFGNAIGSTVQSARALGAGIPGHALKAFGGAGIGANNWATNLGQGFLDTASNAQASAGRFHEAGNKNIADYDKIDPAVAAAKAKADALAAAVPTNVAADKARKAHLEAIERFKAALGPVNAIGSELGNALGRAWGKIGDSAKDAAKAAEDRWKAAVDAVKTKFDDLKAAWDKLRDAQKAQLTGKNGRDSMSWELREARAKSDTEKRSIQFEHAKKLFDQAQNTSDPEVKRNLYEQGRGVAFNLAKDASVSRDPGARKVTDELLGKYQNKFAGLESGDVSNAETQVKYADQSHKDAEEKKRNMEGARNLEAAKEALAPMKGAAIETAKAIFELRDAFKGAAKAGVGVLFGTGRRGNGQAEASDAGGLGHVAG